MEDSSFLPPLAKDENTSNPIPQPEKTETQKPSTKKGLNLEKLRFLVLLLMIVFVPIAFVPSLYVPLDAPKSFFITVGTLLASVLYILSHKHLKTFSVLKSPISKISCLLVVSLFVSSLFSTNIFKSFFGQGFEARTASFLILLFVFASLLISSIIKNKNRVFYIYSAIISLFVFVSFFHIIRLVGGVDFLNLGFFKTTTSTILGRWYDLGIFSASVMILSYLGFRFLSLSKKLKFVFPLLFLLSFFFIVIIDFKMLWAGLSLVFLGMIFFEYRTKSLSVLTVMILVVSTFFLWKGSLVAIPLTKSLNIQQSEIMLPWQATLDIASDTLKESPFFGVGPNRFTNQYLLYKPQFINNSVFWNLEFNSSSSFILDSVVTQGIVGFVLWLIILVLAVYLGAKNMTSFKDKYSKFTIWSSFSILSLLLFLSLVYTPSHTTLFLTFVFASLFISSLVIAGNIGLKDINLSEIKHKKLLRFVYIVVLFLCLFWLLIYIKKYISIYYFERGIRVLNSPTPNVDIVESNFKKALMFDKSDVYYQALSEAHILKISALVQNLNTSGNAENPDQKSVEDIINLINQALEYSKKAVSIDHQNYYNYISEARISEVASTLDMEGAYENTKIAYQNAIAVNPTNPNLYLNLARFEVSRNNLSEAEKYIGESLRIKSDFINAIYLLSQIQVNKGQIKDAITSVEVLSQINPNNPVIFFQLGLLNYNDNNFRSAIEALSRAIEIDSQYANAQYFLGLSYARVGDLNKAVEQFEALAVTNSDNEEVVFILSNLKANRSPFENAQPPIDDEPESRNDLPIEE